LVNAAGKKSIGPNPGARDKHSPCGKLERERVHDRVRETEEKISQYPRGGAATPEKSNQSKVTAQGHWGVLQLEEVIAKYLTFLPGNELLIMA
jgi:hypothetical protein